MEDINKWLDSIRAIQPASPSLATIEEIPFDFNSFLDRELLRVAALPLHNSKDESNNDDDSEVKYLDNR